MEIYLESCRDQWVVLRLTETEIKFHRGERIHTENSYKYTDEMVDLMLSVCAFTREQTWYDRRKWFALHLARA